MNTENTDKEKVKGWILYDGQCPLCLRFARLSQRLLASRQLQLEPLQMPWVRQRLALPEPDLLIEMRFLRADGVRFGGADALMEISRQFWWTWPLRAAARIPAIRYWLRAGYRWLARNRGCANGACANPNVAARQSHRVADFLPLMILPMLTLLTHYRVVPWIFMWIMAVAQFAGCKWLSYRDAIRRGVNPTFLLKLGYLLAWPGMNARKFFAVPRRLQNPAKGEWFFAAIKTIFGLVLLFAATRAALSWNAILAGWVGMFGIIFVLHFGVFHLQSLAWRRVGVNAAPFMQNPLGATSLADFWGRRWNTAFHELVYEFTFQPLRRFGNPAIATLIVFGISGLIHEAVISLPARGGYGLPTFYFILQGCAILFERSRIGRRFRGRFLTIAITAAPAFWLFPPVFVRNVILPMLHAIGAT